MAAAAEQLCGAAKAHGSHAALGRLRFYRGRRYDSILYSNCGRKPTGIYKQQVMWGWNAENSSFGTLMEGRSGQEKLPIWEVRPASDTFGSRGRRANSDRLMAVWKQQ